MEMERGRERAEVGERERAYLCVYLTEREREFAPSFY